MSTNTLVIGASGSIAQAIIQQLLATNNHNVVGVSRSEATIQDPNYKHLVCNDYSKVEIKACLVESKLPELHQVFCSLGMLHDKNMDIFPEKKLEDLNATQLQHYFHINSILPALWLSQVVPLLAKKAASQLVFISARVGSIGDNRLGGWYGYRASKAALNSMIKSAQIELHRRRPKASILLYHPGTVDTPLSQPFQANVAVGKLFTPEFTASQLLALMPSLKPDNAPYYLDWQGKTIPW